MQALLQSALGYHNVYYFSSCSNYDEFYTRILQVIDIGVQSFAEKCEELLVDNIREERKDPEAASCYMTYWIGTQRHHTLVHAGYCGSNNNMGVEVDWYEVKRIAPSSCTVGQHTAALVKFI